MPNFLNLAASAAALLLLALTTTAAAGQIDADVSVKVSSDGAGGYTFFYSGDYVQPNGDLDFTQGGADKNAVRIVFSIDPESVAGVKFMPTGAGAMWIALKSAGDPTGPYTGDQFTGFATMADGARLHLIDKNDDGKTYKYSLRFDLDGALIVHDPEIKNKNTGEY